MQSVEVLKLKPECFDGEDSTLSVNEDKTITVIRTTINSKDIQIREYLVFSYDSMTELFKYLLNCIHCDNKRKYVKLPNDDELCEGFYTEDELDYSYRCPMPYYMHHNGIQSLFHVYSISESRIALINARRTTKIGTHLGVETILRFLGDFYPQYVEYKIYEIANKVF